MNYYGKDIDAIIEWVPSRYCTNQCWYCGLNVQQIESTYQDNVECLLSYIENSNKTFAILLSGGEPFQFPNHIEIMKRITAKNYLMLHSAITEPIDEFINTINSDKIIFMRVALHPKNLKNFDIFFEKVKLLKINNFKPIVVMPGAEQNFDNVPYFHKKFEEINVAFELTLLAGHEHTVKEIEFLKKWMVTNVSIEQMCQFRNNFNKICNAGFNDITIYPNGDITRCSHDEKILCNIIKDKTIKFLNKPNICESNRCGCRNYYYDETCNKDGAKQEMQDLINGYKKPLLLSFI